MHFRTHLAVEPRKLSVTRYAHEMSTNIAKKSATTKSKSSKGKNAKSSPPPLKVMPSLLPAWASVMTVGDPNIPLKES